MTWSFIFKYLSFCYVNAKISSDSKTGPTELSYSENCCLFFATVKAMRLSDILKGFGIG